MDTTVIILSEPLRGQFATKVGDKIKVGDDLIQAESVQWVDWDDCETAARKCDCCGKGMNQGFVVDDSDYVCEACDESGELERRFNAQGYTDIDEAYDNDFVYYTEWTDNDFDYVVTPNSEVVEIIR